MDPFTSTVPVLGCPEFDKKFVLQTLEVLAWVWSFQKTSTVKIKSLLTPVLDLLPARLITQRLRRNVWPLYGMFGKCDVIWRVIGSK